MNPIHGGIAAPLKVPAAAPRPTDPHRNPPWRAVLAVLWPSAVVVAVYATVGRLGFYPTDEGLVLSYSYRLLLGQVPHRDFVSPRPLGSAFIHLIDFAIPGPLFEVSRVITLCEYTAYSLLLAWLIYELAPWRWTLAMTAAVAASVLANLNRFPLMAWYTVDGILCVAGGLLLVRAGARRNSRALIVSGFLLLGFAALTKQSFVPAPAFGWLMLWPRLKEASWTERLRELVWTGACGAAAFVIFSGAVAALGGLHQLRAQILGTAPVYGMSLVYPWLPGRDLVPLLALCAVAAAGAARSVWLRSSSLSFAFVSAVTLVIAITTLSDRLGLSGDEWGTRLFWMTVAYCAVASAVRRSIDPVGLALIGLAWMSSLSYSFFFPNLVGGSLAVYLAHRMWAGVTVPRLRFMWAAPPAAALLVLAICAGIFVNTRQQDVYSDRPAAQLTATLTDVSPEFGGIRTNPSTAQYLAQMADCVKRYPARWVAILPENAAMYPALGLHNPFPIDWMWPYDIHGSETRIVSTADQLNREGDYLVLFQTVDEPQIVNAGSLPSANAAAQIASFTDLPKQIYVRLDGVKTTCGTFLVVYSPPHG